MVFKIDTLIEYISAGVTLLPGDIISTGTPLGVAAFTGVPYLKSGDVPRSEDRGNWDSQEYYKARMIRILKALVSRGRFNSEILPPCIARIFLF